MSGDRILVKRSARLSQLEAGKAAVSQISKADKAMMIKYQMTKDRTQVERVNPIRSW